MVVVVVVDVLVVVVVVITMVGLDIICIEDIIAIQIEYGIRHQL